MPDKPIAEHEDKNAKSGGDLTDKAAQPKEATKTQDLAKAGRDDLDPNAGQE